MLLLCNILKCLVSKPPFIEAFSYFYFQHLYLQRSLAMSWPSNHTVPIDTSGCAVWTAWAHHQLLAGAVKQLVVNVHRMSQSNFPGNRNIWIHLIHSKILVWPSYLYIFFEFINWMFAWILLRFVSVPSLLSGSSTLGATCHWFWADFVARLGQTLSISQMIPVQSSFWDMWCNSASRTVQDETTLTRHICAARRYSFLTALRSTARAAGPATSGRGLGGERDVSSASWVSGSLLKICHWKSTGNYFSIMKISEDL